MKLNVLRFLGLCLLVIFLIVFIFGSPVSAEDELDRVAKSVVQIAWKLPNTQAWRDVLRDPFTGDFSESDLFVQMGTGFLVGVDDTAEFRYVVTNYHVIDRNRALDWEEPFRARNVDEIGVYLVRARDDYVPLSVYGELMTTDMAIMEIDPRHRLFGYEVLDFGHSGMVQRGEDVYAIGFPGTAQTAADLTTASFTDSSLTSGVASRITTVDGVPVIQTDTPVSGGNSGSPLVNSDGVVIGMIMGGMVQRAGGAIIPSQVNYAIQIDELTSFLRSRGIDYQEAGAAAPVADVEPVIEPEPEPVVELEPEPITEEPAEIAQPVTEEGGFPIMYAVLGAAALLVVVILAVVLGKGKQPAAATASATPPPPPSAPAPSTQRSSAPATQAKPTSAAPVTKAKAAGPKVGLKGISGHFAGQSIDFVGGQIVIGRDPRMAQLVYPQGNDEVSRKHLTIRFDEKTQKFVLEDSSSNGTFLSSNERLESGKPYYLNPGDRFYIADSKEVFELTKG